MIGEPSRIDEPIQAKPTDSCQPIQASPKQSLRNSALWAAGAVVAFHVAYSSPGLLFIILYLICLVKVTRAPSGRAAFYLGLSTGLLTVGPQLNCLWVIFGPSAIALWFVLAFWIALFVALARLFLARFGSKWGLLVLPFLWTALEYFRSELYYLRFSWLSVGYGLSASPLLPVYHVLGTYGFAFITVAIATAIALLPLCRALWIVVAAGLALAVFSFISPQHPQTGSDLARRVRVAGVQLEFPIEAEVIAALDKLIEREPDAELLLLSEYTLDGPVPQKLKAWCQERKRYLIVGGKDTAPNSNFYDTAFVVSPDGTIVFRQVKSVPIQFFKDGLPAIEQKLWNSPWGRLGICICYDLSYTRVTDRLVRMGAEAIIVPTMDVVDWGRREHQLHALVAPVRAAEYGVPIFRVASSGISQIVDRFGGTTATAPFPGQQAIISGWLELGAGGGSLPVDRWLAPLAIGVTAILILVLAIQSFRRRKHANYPP